MGNIVINRALGRGTEWVERVNGNDPANSAILVFLLAATGVEADLTLKEKDSLSDLVAGTTNEATNTNYARKTLDQAGGLTVTYDDTNDRVDVDMPDQTWTAVANDGTGAIGDFGTAYDGDTTAGDDTNVLVWTIHDFAVTPDGSDITAQIATAGFFRAS